MIMGSGIKFWLISVPIALFLTALAIWLFRNLVPEKMNNKLVRKFIKSTPEHTAITEAQNFLNEIDAFKNQPQDNLSL
jgi:hypothetical protein